MPAVGGIEEDHQDVSGVWNLPEYGPMTCIDPVFSEEASGRLVSWLEQLEIATAGIVPGWTQIVQAGKELVGPVYMGLAY